MSPPKNLVRKNPFKPHSALLEKKIEIAPTRDFYLGSAGREPNPELKVKGLALGNICSTREDLAPPKHVPVKVSGFLSLARGAIAAGGK